MSHTRSGVIRVDVAWFLGDILSFRRKLTLILSSLFGWKLLQSQSECLKWVEHNFTLEINFIGNKNAPVDLAKLDVKSPTRKQSNHWQFQNAI